MTDLLMYAKNNIAMWIMMFKKEKLLLCNLLLIVFSFAIYHKVLFFFTFYIFLFNILYILRSAENKSDFYELLVYNRQIFHFELFVLFRVILKSTLLFLPLFLLFSIFKNLNNNLDISFIRIVSIALVVELIFFYNKKVDTLGLIASLIPLEMFLKKDFVLSSNGDAFFIAFLNYLIFVIVNLKKNGKLKKIFKL